MFMLCGYLVWMSGFFLFPLQVHNNNKKYSTNGKPTSSSYIFRVKATYLNVYIEKFKFVQTATQLISLSYIKSGTRDKSESFWTN